MVRKKFRPWAIACDTSRLARTSQLLYRFAITYKRAGTPYLFTHGMCRVAATSAVMQADEHST